MALSRSVQSPITCRVDRMARAEEDYGLHYGLQESERKNVITLILEA